MKILDENFQKNEYISTTCGTDKELLVGNTPFEQKNSPQHIFLCAADKGVEKYF